MMNFIYLKINIGYNDLNINKIELINIIKKFKSSDLKENFTNDSRDYSVDFNLLTKYNNLPYFSYEKGIENYLKY